MDWDGSFIGNYSVNSGSPVEQYTTSGPEASVTYVGPHDYRVPFLQSIFGAWTILDTLLCPEIEEPELRSPRVCAAHLNPFPCPYPYPILVEGEPACPTESCLWPDTFTCRPAGNNLAPYLYDCGDEELGPCERPIMDECGAEIQINFRYKNHARLPDIFSRCSGIPYVPPIPNGTFTSVRVQPRVEVFTLPSRHFAYDLKVSQEIEGQFCEDCFVQNPDTEAPLIAQVPQLKPDIDVGIQLASMQIELTWENVPLPPWDIIRMANGRLNAGSFLGFPAGSVLFEFGEPEITGQFGCQDVYRLRYMFHVKTVPITAKLTGGTRPTPYEIAEATDDEIYLGQIGIWNRRWHDCPLTFNVGPAGELEYCTNWVRISSRQLTCCDEDPPGPFEYFPLHLLFAMNVCNSNGTAPTFGVANFSYFTPHGTKVASIPAMAQPTFAAINSSIVGTGAHPIKAAAFVPAGSSTCTEL